MTPAEEEFSELAENLAEAWVSARKHRDAFDVVCQRK
jgi:hypothetical protein